MWKEYFYQSWDVEVGEQIFAKCAKKKKIQWEPEKTKMGGNEEDEKVREESGWILAKALGRGSGEMEKDKNLKLRDWNICR